MYLIWSLLMDIYIGPCVFAITNNVAANISVAVSLQPRANVSVGQTPKIELHFKFDGHCQTVLPSCVPIHTSVRCVRVLISPLYLQSWILCLPFLKTYRGESDVSLFCFAHP